MNARTFGIAVVGTGFMGRRMLAALHRHPRFDLRGLWDPDVDALRTAVERTPGAHAAVGLDAVVSEPGVDIVYLASPPAHHLAGVAAALAAGRGCFCEKPLAADVAEATALRDLVVASGLPFAVNFPFARSPASLRLVESVRSGALGPWRSASLRNRFARWPRDWQTGASAWLDAPVEGGFTREVLSHFVFLAERLFGPATVADVELVRDEGRAESALRANLVHRAITIPIDAAVDGDIVDTNRFEVVGADRTAAIVDWSRFEHGGHLTERVDSTADTLDGLSMLLEGRNDHGLATVDEALSVVRIVEALLAAKPER